MVMKRIIPCLDVRMGRTVKGVRFQNLTDVGDPVELAERYANDGADELVLLDITATLDNRLAFLDVVSAVASVLSIPCTVGGGVATVGDVERLLKAGADKVSINSAALAAPQLIRSCADAFGEQCIVVAIDSRRTPAGHQVFSRSGSAATGRDTIAWANEAADRGAGEILLTSMDRDGTGLGYDTALTAAVASQVTVGVVASGGAGTVHHVADVLEAGAQAALLAGILHRGEMNIPTVKRAAADRRIAIRL